jgi:hypothetical protein
MLEQPERSELDVWDSQDFENFQNSLLRDSADLTGLVAALQSKAFLLENFVRSLFIASFHGLQDEELRARVNALCCELESKPLPVKVIAFLNGLSVVESPLCVSDVLTLRRPVPEDVTEEVIVDEYGSFTLPLSETWFRLVGEFVFEVVSTGEAQDKFLRTIEALRLFRVGGINTNRYRMVSRHFMSGGILFAAQKHSQFSYTLQNSDVNALSEFLRNIVPLLPDAFQMDQATTDVGIARTLHRCVVSEWCARKGYHLGDDGPRGYVPEKRARTDASISSGVAMFLKLLALSLTPKRLTLMSSRATKFGVHSSTGRP